MEGPRSGPRGRRAAQAHRSVPEEIGPRGGGRKGGAGRRRPGDPAAKGTGRQARPLDGLHPPRAAAGYGTREGGIQVPQKERLTVERFDTIVIGGGPAGLMAAGQAAAAGERVLLVEKNASLGEKLLLAGRRRCNITNAESDVMAFLSRYRENGRFLNSAFS